MAKKAQTIDPIDSSLDSVAKAIIASGKPPRGLKALYQGPLPIGDVVELDCAILDDKENTRVINMTSVFKAFDRVPRSNNRLINRPAFIDAQSLQPFIDQELVGLINPIEYLDGKSTKIGYNALILPAICELYLKARRSGALTLKQEHLAAKAEILQSSFAKVGITALIDEATGFQKDRKHNALRLLLAKYIAEGLQKWIHTFPDAFFAELDRLYNNEPTTSHKRPQYYGHFINRYIYEPIENGYVKSKLNELNIDDKGKRKARFHQWLSEQGRNILIHQIGRVQGLMEMCQQIGQFKKAAEKQKKVSIAPYLFDEMNQIIE
ncbi:MAG: P63C domain-containing protein [Nitrospirales bacterium]